MLLLTFPMLKLRTGEVEARLRVAEPREDVLETWKHLVAQEILPEDEDAGF